MTDPTNVDEDRTDSFVDEGADPTPPADTPADPAEPAVSADGEVGSTDADGHDVPPGTSVDEADPTPATTGEPTDPTDVAEADDAADADGVDVPAGTSVDDVESANGTDDADGPADVVAGAVDESDLEPEGQTEIAVEPEEVVDDETMRRAVEAILMVSDEPLPAMTLARAVGRPTSDVGDALVALAAEYTEQGRGFELREVAGGWRYYTRDDAAKYVERFVLDGQQARLTQAALETLAVVAYKQPVSRARVSAIRGVNVDGVMRTLVTRGLVEEAGTDTESQATLYRTTSYFLERMGMQGLDDLPELAPYLPDMDDIEDELTQSPPPAPTQPTPEDTPALPHDSTPPDSNEPPTSAEASPVPTDTDASDDPGPSDRSNQTDDASALAGAPDQSDGASGVDEVESSGMAEALGDEGERVEGGGGVRWGHG